MPGTQNPAGPEHIELFLYLPSPEAPSQPDAPDWPEITDPSHTVSSQSGCHQHPAPPDHSATHAELEKSVAELTRRSFEEGRERGRQEALQGERDAHAAALKSVDDRQRNQHAELVRVFAAERDHYLHAVEQEIVKLALAVAARILRREAQMDPLLLTGAVRVALGQLSASTEVRLRVPAADLKLWTEAVALIPNLALKPFIQPGEGMRLGDCILETSIGSVDLGVRSQIGEIERGFFDRAGSVDPSPTSKSPNGPNQ